MERLQLFLLIRETWNDRIANIREEILQSKLSFFLT